MKKKNIYIWLCICMVILLFPVHVVAAPGNEETRLTIKYPVSRVNFRFFKVANFSEYGDFDLVSPFDIYADEIAELENLETNEEEITAETWRNLAYTLENYVVSEQICYDFIEQTSESGRIIINNIEKGLYLILGEQVVTEEKTYTPAPMLMTVPNRDEGGNWDSQVVLEYTGKTSINDIYDEYTVQKIWVDDGKEKKRPDEIVVNLYMAKSDEPYDTVVLNEDNNWKYTWTELPNGEKWNVSEQVVPEDYKVSYQVDGSTFAITNTYDGPDTPTVGGRLPQTGQLWWPVPILAILGIALFAIGWARRNSEDR